MSLTDKPDEEIYGAFRLGTMDLAMPMAVLREVVPCTNLQQLPTVASWVLGGLNLRGVLVPVVDLSLLLQKPVPPEDRRCVVIVAHEGRMAGIVATAVDCLFNASTGQINLFHSQDPISRVARGSLQNTVSGSLLTVLCTDSLMALPQLPAVSDPQAHLQNHDLNQEELATSALARIPLLLMRSQGMLFALNPRDIETTMPRAQVERKDVCQDYYKGNATYRGREIPAIELTEYLKIGPLEQKQIKADAQPQPAFVLRFEQGVMAVLIDEILDIVQVNPQHLLNLPRVSALQTQVLRQTIARQAIYPDQTDGEHYYVIHPQGLVADPRLADLAKLVHIAESAKNIATESGHAEKDPQQQQTDQRVIVFEMNGDHAIPIGEIAEVLSYCGVKEAFSRDTPFRGIMTHRNRAIPVVDLAQHMGLPRQTMSSSSNVLVVQLDGQPIGLAVGCLRSIEQAQWTPEIPVLGAARTERPGNVRHTQKLVEVLIGNERKLLEVISARDEARRFVEIAGEGSCSETVGASPVQHTAPHDSVDSVSDLQETEGQPVEA